MGARIIQMQSGFAMLEQLGCLGPVRQKEHKTDMNECFLCCLFVGSLFFGCFIFNFLFALFALQS